MSNPIKQNIYIEADWVQNIGDSTIHAKRIKGKFRLIKWISGLIWLPFFTLAYISWNNKQAILFDVENRQYHIFNITIFPQDIWLLTMILLFLAISLAVITTVLGRVFCGYFCFQTVWTDIFTKIEELFEGNPEQRYKLEKQALSVNKIIKKLGKHTLWIVISLFSGGTWMLYFGVEWADYWNGNASLTTWNISLSIALGSYIFAGFMREQTCLWICPYARIQGAMVDAQTILPTYDYKRGEPRGKLKKSHIVEGNGDCVDCKQCIAVCPTGVDIRKGQEYGCITCGLCIDACDSVMTKIGKKTGLIRYTSLNELKQGISNNPLYKRGRVILYTVILSISLGILLYGLNNLAPLELSVLHGRQPLFVLLSDGSIRNKYKLKIINKSTKLKQINIQVKSNIKSLKTNSELNWKLKPGNIQTITLYLSANKDNIKDNKITFVVSSEEYTVTQQSKFFWH